MMREDSCRGIISRILLVVVSFAVISALGEDIHMYIMLLVAAAGACWCFLSVLVGAAVSARQCC